MHERDKVRMAASGWWRSNSLDFLQDKLAAEVPKVLRECSLWVGTSIRASGRVTHVTGARLKERN